ncbi:MAG: nucleotidyltransferase family protein [Bacteroidales bacterium]
MTIASDAPLSDIDVVILAGGLGTRLRGVLGDELPKVLAPVGNQPFLDHMIAWLHGYGARRLILCLGYKANKVQEHLAQIEPSPMSHIQTVVEPEPLGTGGALRFAAPHFCSDPVLVVNGDSWTDTDLAAFVARHHAQKAYLSILCADVPDASRYGRLEIAEDGTVLQFREKEEHPRPGCINAGVYLLSRQAVADLVGSQAVSFEKDFLQRIAPGRIFTHSTPGARFIDIGTPDSLSQAPEVIVQ